MIDFESVRRRNEELMNPIRVREDARRELKAQWTFEAAEDLKSVHSFMDVGYFYCPYTPIMKEPVVVDDESFKPRKGILTRYGKRLLEEGEKFYGEVKLEIESEEIKPKKRKLGGEEVNNHDADNE